MMLRVLTAAFIVLASLHASWAFAAAPTRAEVQALPAVFKDGLIYLKVSLKGGQAVWMLLDTGDEGCSLDVSEAKRRRLRLRPDSVGVGGFGEKRQEAFKARIALQIGAPSKGSIACRAYTLPPVQGPDGRRIAGVLGYAVLAGKVLTIDYPNQRVELSLGAGKGGAPIDLVANLPVVEIKISGRSTRALIDTGGAFGLLITPMAAERLGLSAQMETATAIEGVGASGRQTVRVGTAPSVSIAGVEHLNPTVVYANFGTEAVPFDAALGRDILSRYKLVLDYRMRTFRVDQ